MNEKKWYNSILLIILALIFFWPLGLILLSLHPKMKKAGMKVSYMVVIIIFMTFFLALFAPSSHSLETITIEVVNPQAAYDINTDIQIRFKIEPEDAEVDGIKYYVEGDSMTFSASGVHTGDQEGTFHIAVKSGKVESNILSIPVIDIKTRREKRLAAEQAEQEEKELAPEEQTPLDEEVNPVSEEPTEQESSDPPSTEETSEQNSETQEPSASTDEQASSSQNDSKDIDNDDNFNTYDNSEQQQTITSYVLNTSTFKIHRSSCRDVKKIAPENRSISTLSLEELQNQGYSTCGHCF